MRSFAFEDWDEGRLTVNSNFAPVLRANGWITFDRIMKFAGGEVAKNLLRERTTTRIELSDASGGRPSFYLKRHERPPLKEFVKPLLRLAWPIIGARNEWNAILRFHEAGIPTMVPVVLGRSVGRSFLVTAAIEGCRKLSELVTGDSTTREVPRRHAQRQIIGAVADVARTMHQAGMHHQDFYLTHLMAPASGAPRPIHVLDLGRVRTCRTLSSRWIVKDLAQLDYSATGVSASDRLRFLRAYLERRIDSSDRGLVRRIVRKSHAIARHSRKNGL